MDVHLWIDREMGILKEVERNDLFQQQERALAMARAEYQPAALFGAHSVARISEIINPRPFHNLFSQWEEQTLRYDRLMPPRLPDLAIHNQVSEALKVGEAFRKLAEPMTAMKSALEPFMNFSSHKALATPSPMSYFADIERNIDLLRGSALAQASEVQSVIFETINGLSAMVNSTNSYFENPVFKTVGATAEQEFSLGEVVDFVGESFNPAVQTTAWSEVIELLRSIQADLRSRDKRDNLALAVGVLSLLASLVSLGIAVDQRINSPRIQQISQQTTMPVQEQRQTPPLESDDDFDGCQ